MGSSGVKADALGNYGTNSATAAGVLSTVNPIYNKMAAGNMGYTPQQQADLLTQGEQSTGGSQAGAVGAGNLLAARTNNVGGAAAAIDDSARNGIAQNSADALKVATDSDQLASQNQKFGLSGLNSIYDNSNDQANASLNTANNTAKPFWQQALLAGIGSAGQVASAAVTKCWIAAELYGGWYEPRTMLIREWLDAEFSRTAFGRLVVRLYVRFGERIAARIRTDKVSRWVMLKLFNCALRKASK